MATKKKKIVPNKDEYCYVTRDNHASHAEVYPTTVGIRKFNTICPTWGAAWSKETPTGYFSHAYKGYCEMLKSDECRKRFGFYPRPGTAYLVNGREITKVDIDFTN